MKENRHKSYVNLKLLEQEIIRQSFEDKIRKIRQLEAEVQFLKGVLKQISESSPRRIDSWEIQTKEKENVP